MKSFNSFDQIAATLRLPDQWLPNHADYWAHTHSQKAPEKMLAHIRLVNEYALNLIRTHQLDEVVERLVEDLLEQSGCRQSTGNYIKSLFLTTIVFHDYGKVNPNFQVKRMKNPNFRNDRSIKIDSQHSRLSAYLYLNHHFASIEKDGVFNNDEQVFLKTLTFLFANSIFLHHSSSFHHDVKLDEELMPSLRRFLTQMENDVNQDEQILDHEGLFQYFQEELHPLKSYFSIYALLKLNFSLLTASDYIATGDFMLDIKVTDFGLMDKRFKESFRSAFRTKKLYNKTVFKYLEAYRDFPFDKLQTISKRNLNRLRQKLTAEVIGCIRENSQSRLFYLEAPTGAGKTNLSLALALELLEANPELNKVFYVFPFTTLITQTFKGIQDTAGLDNTQIVQLHSKAGFHQKGEEKEDGFYGNEKETFIDNLFIHYPVCLLTHIRFFDILKGNDKESNYILHRLSNSVVIIDELQSYNPRHWDKVIFFLSEYARFFNIRFVLMSATLPYIDELLDKDSTMLGKVVKLVKNKNEYFLNPNFGKRVSFDFSLLEKWKKPANEDARMQYLNILKNFLFEKSEVRAASNDGRVRVIIEFIKKKSAAEFYRMVHDDPNFNGYEKVLISGEILEPRRREIIDAVKEDRFDKILLVTTQVVEAGVDIDMDLGFKDKSVADSDEQLAGRVNRNASKSDCTVFLFDFDEKANIYGKDERYKLKIDLATHKSILGKKDFQKLYDLVKAKINERNSNEYLLENLLDYLCHFKQFDFRKINREFRLIEEGGISVFVPLPIPASHLAEDEKVLKIFNIEPDKDGFISGRQVWEKYEAIVEQSKINKSAFVANQILLKQVGGLMSKFIFSFFVQPGKHLHSLSTHGEDKYGFFLLSHWNSNDIYTYEGGLNMEKVNSDLYL